MLLQVVQDGGGTRIADYVHWKNQKYLEAAKTVEVEATVFSNTKCHFSCRYVSHLYPFALTDTLSLSY